MIDLSTEYLGLKLKNPIVVSSTPLSESLQNVHRMEDCGAAAIILASLFEEQIALESHALDRDLSQGTESYAESLSYLPEFQDYRQGQDTYLGHLTRVKGSCGLPILASINGATPGGWVSFAREVERAGADGLELNTYSLATDAAVPANEVEQGLLDLVRQVRASVRIPIAVKLSPQFTSIPHLVRQLEDAGADAVVLFNRFYQPDFDIENLNVVPRLSFSRPEELLLRLHWTAILYTQTNCDIGITGGVHSAEDVLKSVMAGAQVAMLSSALHLYGIEHIDSILGDLVRWMEKHEYESIRQMRGSLSRRAVPDTSPFERGNYIKTLSSYTLRKPNPVLS
jgi:dihydroorotate dehydrogenase (fumarate)